MNFVKVMELGYCEALVEAFACLLQYIDWDLLAIFGWSSSFCMDPASQAQWF